MQYTHAAAAQQPEELRCRQVVEPCEHLCEGPLTRPLEMGAALLAEQGGEVVRRQLSVERCQREEDLEAAGG